MATWPKSPKAGHAVASRADSFKGGTESPIPPGFWQPMCFAPELRPPKAATRSGRSCWSRWPFCSQATCFAAACSFRSIGTNRLFERLVMRRQPVLVAADQRMERLRRTKSTATARYAAYDAPPIEPTPPLEATAAAITQNQSNKAEPPTVQDSDEANASDFTARLLEAKKRAHDDRTRP